MAPDAAFAALHALRVKGFATVEAVAAFTGLDAELVARQMHQLAVADLVRHRRGPINAWTLGGTGRTRHGELLADERHAVEARGTAPALRDVLASFRLHDPPFKELCTAWQLGGRTRARVAALRELHGEVGALTDPATVPLARLGVYQARFEAAWVRVVAGDDDALTRPLSESYHDVWMELHEDLLVTLGVERSAADGV